jgi:hypothetical protein
MKYLTLLLVVFAVSACEEKKVVGSTEKIEVQRFDRKAYNEAAQERRSQEAAQMNKKAAGG